MTDPRSHWEDIHTAKGDAVSWYQPDSTVSLAMIQACEPDPGARILDVGAGASVLVEALLERGLRPTLLDLAKAPLARVWKRLGSRAEGVEFQVGDITRIQLPVGSSRSGMIGRSSISSPPRRTGRPMRPICGGPCSRMALSSWRPSPRMVRRNAAACRSAATMPQASPGNWARNSSCSKPPGKAIPRLSAPPRPSSTLVFEG